MTTTFTEPQKIFDYVTDDNLGVCLWQQSTLEEITKNSGPLAANNEFQIHYWALVIRLKFTDSSLIDICLPTAVYNYEQEVSPAHIDFELKDVNEVSEMVLPIHNMVVNKIVPQLEVLEFPDCTYELLNVPLNTMHRHPTGVSSFSGTDLRKNHKTDTGIVFPLKTGNNTPSFSSIIYNNPVKMVRTEYRVATGDVDTNGIEYIEGNCYTNVMGEVQKPSKAMQLLGKTPKDTSYNVGYTEFTLPDNIVRVMNQLEYTPNTDMVNPDNVKKKTFTTTKTNGNYPFTTGNNSIWEDYGYKKPKTTTSLFMTDDYLKDINELLPINLKSTVDVQLMTRPELEIHLNQIEKYYYADPTMSVEDYAPYTDEELRQDCLDLQLSVVDEVERANEYDREEDDYTTLQEKEEFLLEVGARQSDINNASDEQIEKWYKEVTS